MRTLKWISLIMIVLLPACSIMDLVQPRPTPTADNSQTLQAARTDAVGTAIAEITQQATTAPPTSSPTQPTATQTLQPTRTYTATLTATATPVPPTATHTPTFTATSTATFTRTPTATLPKSLLKVLGREKNRAVTLQADYFPKNETFQIWVGASSTFSTKYVVMESIHTGSTGSFEFTVLLPIETRNVENITVRLDNMRGNFAQVTFQNIDSGKAAYDVTLVSAGRCEFTSRPAESRTLSPYEDFDAVWTIKNTSLTDWNVHEIDYEFIGGEAMHKYQERYDIPQTVKPGETITIVVDMLAPDRAGNYRTHWGMVLGRTVLCHLPLRVIVR